MNWDDLRHLRENGQRPMKLIVSTAWRWCQSLDEGVMVVIHGKGEPFPVDLLHGLDVELRFEECAQATAVARLTRARGVQPARMHVWCRCENFSGPFWSPDCKTGDEIRAAWETVCAA